MISLSKTSCSMTPWSIQVPVLSSPLGTAFRILRPWAQYPLRDPGHLADTVSESKTQCGGPCGRSNDSLLGNNTEALSAYTLMASLRSDKSAVRLPRKAYSGRTYPDVRGRQRDLYIELASILHCDCQSENWGFPVHSGCDGGGGAPQDLQDSKSHHLWRSSTETLGE